jgi:5'-3' exonuclease
MKPHTYIEVDLLNLFYRARHVVRGDADTRLGMALHITLASVRKAWNDFNGTHVIFFLEGRSWRKDFYAPYKFNRVEVRAAKTMIEKDEDDLFFETLNALQLFLIEKTNCTVLQHPLLEADDLIAGFIQSHPDDNHVIISTDSDFIQLISENVSQYNGVSEIHITHEGYFDVKGKPVIDAKTKLPKPALDPQWELFKKCFRGDKSDNVFSAYPGVREKGTKSKVGLTEAFNDRYAKGWAWNNLLLQRWVDHNKVEHKVIDDYNRNVTLIDLTAQPANIRKILNEITTNITPKNESMIGVKFLKLCGMYNLVKLSDQAASYAELLAAPYQL